MFRKDLKGNRGKRCFDDLESEKLGNYVYALRDPRDGKVFYIGQGKGNRLFDHFGQAETELWQSRIMSSKVLRILDIWSNDEDVDWTILAHHLEPEQINVVESVAIDVLGLSQNGVCLNEVRGPHSSMLSQDEIKSMGAAPINPTTPLSKVFLFSIKNGLADGRTTYDATRSAWYVKPELQELPAYAVGMKNGISVGAFQINSWASSGEKHEFQGIEYPPLLNYNWSKVISTARGFWQRGNYLVAEFDGKGKFRILRGAGTNKDWADI